MKKIKKKIKMKIKMKIMKKIKKKIKLVVRNKMILLQIIMILINKKNQQTQPNL